MWYLASAANKHQFYSRSTVTDHSKLQTIGGKTRFGVILWHPAGGTDKWQKYSILVQLLSRSKLCIEDAFMDELRQRLGVE